VRKVVLLGSTGSIGTQTLDVVREESDRYQVVALGAQQSVDALVAQALEFRPRVVAVGDRGAPDAYQATAWLSPSGVGR